MLIWEMVPSNSTLHTKDFFKELGIMHQFCIIFCQLDKLTNLIKTKVRFLSLQIVYPFLDFGA